MLREFLAESRGEIVNHVRSKRASYLGPADERKHDDGVGELVDQLHRRLGVAPDASQPDSRPDADAVRGLSLAQLVHGYTDIWQAVIELAAERGLQFSTLELRSFNHVLDESIARAVAQHARQVEESDARRGTERLAELAHELRNSINTAMLAFGLLKRGVVEPDGNTAGVLDRSFARMRDLIDRSLTQVRVESGMVHLSRLRIATVVEEAELAGSLDARNRGVVFTVSPGTPDCEVEADRQMLAGAIANLLQNAFKFTPKGGHVSLSIHSEAGRVLIEVQDECGGLPGGTAEGLFVRFEQRSSDRSGIGMGLSITRASMRAMGGDVCVRDLPGKGCIFTLELPALGSG